MSNTWQNRIVGFQMKAVNELLAHPHNPRRHPVAQREGIRGSLDAIGWYDVLIENQRTGHLLNGHARVEEALTKDDNMEVPVLIVDVSEDEELLILASHDFLTELAEYDKGDLSYILSSLSMNDNRLEDLLDTLATSQGIDLSSEDDPIHEPEAQLDKLDLLQAQWKVKAGDLWTIGHHRLLCGDCTQPEQVARLMNGYRGDILINDPPYGMSLDADFSAMQTRSKFAREKKATGGHHYSPITGDNHDYDASPIRAIFEAIPEQFWFGADYYSASLGDTMHEGSWLVWDKRVDESLDAMFGSGFELLWSSHSHKRDMLRVKWAGIFGVEQEPSRERFHPSHKPVKLYSEIIARYSIENALVVDVYAGSGSSMVAAEQLGRRAYLMEIEPVYCSVILDRMKAMGLTPVLEKE